MFIEFYPLHSIICLCVVLLKTQNIFGDKCSNIQYEENIERVISLIRFSVPLINILFSLTKEVKGDENISEIFHRKPLGEIISTQECFISHKLKGKCKASFRRFLLLHKGEDFNVTDVYYY